MLINNGIINAKYQWTFEDGRLVVLGNCFEEKNPECLWLVYSLEEKAEKCGGRVHFIPGKKELENLNGNWSVKHPRYAIRSSKYSGRVCVLYDGNGELYRWLRTKNLAEVIGDYLFTHGTVMPYDLTNVSSYKVEDALSKSTARTVIVGCLSTPGVTSLLDGKLINVSTVRNNGAAKGLFINLNTLFLVDTSGNAEQLNI